jgi:hypothetical protein
MKTLWVRPHCFAQYLVSEAEGNLKDIVDGYFNSDDHETFIKEVTEKMENEKFLPMSEKNSREPFIVELECEYDETEVIEFKLIEMTDEEMDNMNEFSGW